MRDLLGGLGGPGGRQGQPAQRRPLEDGDGSALGSQPLGQARGERRLAASGRSREPEDAAAGRVRRMRRRSQGQRKRDDLLGGRLDRVGRRVHW